MASLGEKMAKGFLTITEEIKDKELRDALDWLLIIITMLMVGGVWYLMMTFAISQTVKW